MPKEFSVDTKTSLRINASPEFRKLLAYVVKQEGFDSVAEFIKHLIADYAYTYHGITVQDFEQFSVQDIDSMQKRLTLEIDKRTRAEKQLKEHRRKEADKNRQVRDILRSYGMAEDIIDKILN